MTSGSFLLASISTEALLPPLAVDVADGVVSRDRVVSLSRAWTLCIGIGGVGRSSTEGLLLPLAADAADVVAGACARDRGVSLSGLGTLCIAIG